MRWSDADIRGAVERELVEARVGGNITVTVAKGQVVLEGKIAHFPSLRSAVEAAHRVPGVLGVRYDLIVHPVRSPSDTEIFHAVRHALQWDALVSDERLEVSVVQGVVTLGGTVDTTQQRQEASRAIERILGVRDIDNRIEVRLHHGVDEVHQAIDEALARHASRQGHHIQVRIESEHIVLEGVVQSVVEHELIVGAARAMTASRSVIDRILVERHDPSMRGCS